MRINIHPARNRICGKGQDQCGNGMVDFGVAGNGRDPLWLHLHGGSLFSKEVLELQRGRLLTVVARGGASGSCICRPSGYSTVTINLLKPRKTLFSKRSSS